MKTQVSFYFLLTCLLLHACKKEVTTNTKQKVVPSKATSNAKTDTIAKKELKEEKKEMDWIAEVMKTVPKNLKPVLGYRFIIEGDFNGDGKKEKLIEHYYSEKEKKETCKYYENIEELDQLIAVTIRKQTRSYLLSDAKKIDTLNFNYLDNFGLAFLKNEGDLNGDGTDEISYVLDYADYSSLNSWHIATYKNNQWKDIYTFPIWDWQLPDLPDAPNQYGLFGVQNKIITTENDSLNKALEKQIKEFKGLVHKVKKNRIEVIYRTDDADEGKKIVKLDKLTSNN